MNTKAIKKAGYALVTVMGSMAILGITFTMIYTSGSQSAFNAGRMRNKAQAAVYAEAGVEFAYALLREDYDNRLEPSRFRLNTNTTYTTGQDLVSTYGDGSFTLDIIPSTNGQYVLIHSIGTCRGVEVEVEVLTEDDNWTESTVTVAEEIPNYGDMDVFKMVMATEGEASFRGTSDTIGDDFIIHSNGDLTINGSITVNANIQSSTSITIGNNKTVNGTATAPDVNTGKKGGASGGEFEQAVAPITIPDIDLDPYIRHAEYYGATKSGGTTISSNPPGGIWYVDGDVTVSGTVTATIIASGTITIANNCDLTATHGIAIANTGAGNNIKMTASKGKVTGLLYSGDGSFTQNGGDITGQVIAKLGADKGGNGVLKYQQFLPVYPEYGGPDDTGSDAEPKVVIAAWQK